LLTPLVAEFAERGYIVLIDALSREDLAALNRAVDDELELRPELWIARPGGRSDNIHALLANPAFDRTILNPRVLGVVAELMGSDVCFDEFLLTIRSPCGIQPPRPEFRRDGPYLAGHPLALRHLSVVYYLTDHGQMTHHWSVVPENASEAPVERSCTVERLGQPLFGQAGSAFLLNAASCHAIVRRRTPFESRTIRVDFGHRGLPSIGNDSIVPGRLLESPQREVRNLFSRTNLITQLVSRKTST
jgi:hypothetical protein